MDVLKFHFIYHRKWLKAKIMFIYLLCWRDYGFSDKPHCTRFNVFVHLEHNRNWTLNFFGTNTPRMQEKVSQRIEIL